MGVGLDLSARATVEFFEGDVAAFDGMVGVEDEDAVGSGINQGVEAAFLVTDLGVELGIEDGDGSLVGEGLEQQFIVGGKQVGVAAEDKEDADDLPVGCQGDADTVQQTHAGGIGEVLEHAVQFDQVELGGFFLGQERFEVTQEGGGDAVRRSHAPAAAFLEGQDASLTGQHFDGDAQDARQQLIQVEFLGKGTRYFEQVVALADAEIRKHGHFRNKIPGLFYHREGRGL